MCVKQDDYHLQNLTFFVTVKEISPTYTQTSRVLEPSPFGGKFNDFEYIVTTCFSCRVLSYSSIGLNVFEVVAYFNEGNYFLKK